MLQDLRVLVVDDDPEILELLAAFLESKRNRVTARRTAREALHDLRDEAFDLVITDIRMAGMNGFEFVKIVRKKYPAIAILMMTAYSETYSLSAALGAGADGYISKPFSLEKFSLIFEQAYWNALSRQDWWDAHAAGKRAESTA